MALEVKGSMKASMTLEKYLNRSVLLIAQFGASSLQDFLVLKYTLL